MQLYIQCIRARSVDFGSIGGLAAYAARVWWLVIKSDEKDLESFVNCLEKNKEDVNLTNLFRKGALTYKIRGDCPATGSASMPS